MKYVPAPRLLSLFAGGSLISVLVVLLGSGTAPVWAVVRSGAPRYFSNELRILPSRYKADGPLMGAVALVLTSFFNSFDHSSRATPANSVSIRASA